MAVDRVFEDGRAAGHLVPAPAGGGSLLHVTDADQRGAGRAIVNAAHGFREGLAFAVPMLAVIDEAAFPRVPHPAKARIDNVRLAGGQPDGDRRGPAIGQKRAADDRAIGGMVCEKSEASVIGATVGGDVGIGLQRRERLGGDVHRAVHDEAVPHGGADVRINALAARRGEDQLRAFAGVERLCVPEDFFLLGHEILRRSLGAERERAGHDFLPRAGLDDDQVVDHWSGFSRA